VTLVMVVGKKTRHAASYKRGEGREWSPCQTAPILANDRHNITFSVTRKCYLSVHVSQLWSLFGFFVCLFMSVWII